MLFDLVCSVQSSTAFNEETIYHKSLIMDQCLVCLDVASGLHYGILSCNGCKTFFRRAITKKISYTCIADGKCSMIKAGRCACRYCRLQKCLQVGMDITAIQKDRRPIGYTKRNNKKHRMKAKFLQSGISGDKIYPYCASPLKKQFIIDMNQDDIILFQLSEIERRCSLLRLSTYQPEESLDEQMQSTSLLCDAEFMNKVKDSHPGHSYDFLKSANFGEYHYWYERNWFVMMEWIKTQPTLQQLSTMDKLSLLRNSMVCYPSLVDVYYSPEPSLNLLVLPCGAYIDCVDEPYRSNAYNNHKRLLIEELMKPMRNLSMDLVEFSAFKTIFFLNLDSEGLSNSHRAELRLYKSRIASSVYQYIKKKVGEEDAIARFGNILLLGSVLSKISYSFRQQKTILDCFDMTRLSLKSRQFVLSSID